MKLFVESSSNTHRLAESEPIADRPIRPASGCQDRSNTTTFATNGPSTAVTKSISERNETPVFLYRVLCATAATERTVPFG